MNLVIDASVSVKWFVREVQPEPHTDEALHLLKLIQSGDIQPLQPVHWMPEVIAVLTRIAPADISDIVTLLNVLEFDVVDDIDIYQRATQLSIQFQHHLFDTLYHAVSIENDTFFITADKKYFNKSKTAGHIMLLENFPEQLDNIQ